MPPDTSTLRCPFKIDTTLDQGIDCETTQCAAWNDEAGECMILQAILMLNETEHAIKSLDRGDIGV
jgi:hypothetical protein